MDRYEFACVVDDIFKECKTVEEMCNRYVQLKKDLDNLFRQNTEFLIVNIKKGDE